MQEICLTIYARLDVARGPSPASRRRFPVPLFRPPRRCMAQRVRWAPRAVHGPRTGARRPGRAGIGRRPPSAAIARRGEQDGVSRVCLVLTRADGGQEKTTAEHELLGTVCDPTGCAVRRAPSHGVRRTKSATNYPRPHQANEWHHQQQLGLAKNAEQTVLALASLGEGWSCLSVHAVKKDSRTYSVKRLVLREPLDSHQTKFSGCCQFAFWAWPLFELHIRQTVTCSTTDRHQGLRSSTFADVSPCKAAGQRWDLSDER